MQQKAKLSTEFILIISFLVSISPFAVDTYLSSFSQMSVYYNTSINMVEISLGVYLVGLAVGQLIGGPLADKYNKKLFATIGIVIFSIASIVIIFTTKIEYFWILRAIQALGSGFITVSAMGMIRDMYSGKEASKAISVIGIVMTIAPILAPIIGTTIINIATWHYIFVFLTVYSVFGIFLIKQLTIPIISDKNSKAVENYKKVLNEKLPVILMIALSFSFSTLFLFITKSSFMYMEVFKFSANEFTIVYSIIVFAFAIFGFLNILLLKKFSTYELLYKGVIVQLVLAILLLLSYIFSFNIFVITIILMFCVGTLELIFANAFSLILERFNKLSSTASALTGVMNYLFAGAISFLVSILHDGTLFPLFIFLVIVSAIAFLIIFKYRVEIKKLSHH